MHVHASCTNLHRIELRLFDARNLLFANLTDRVQS